MENTHTISKSFKLNTFWLNLLILFREFYQAYYRVFIPAALLSLLLPLLKLELYYKSRHKYVCYNLSKKTQKRKDFYVRL